MAQADLAESLKYIALMALQNLPEVASRVHHTCHLVSIPPKPQKLYIGDLKLLYLGNTANACTRRPAFDDYSASVTTSPACPSAFAAPQAMLWPGHCLGNHHVHVLLFLTD